jgi:hypothetical protein
MQICSYFGNLYVDALKEHVKEIKAKGFDTILFCITETDMLYNLETFQEFRVIAEIEGMKTWATYWGLFAGEAICKTCDFQDWVDEVSAIGFKNVMIDEPKIKYDWDGFIAKNKKTSFHLCLSDDQFNKMSDEEIIDMPVKSIGVSNYHWTKDWMKITSRSEAIAKRLNKLRPDDNFVFIQGFDIPEGFETMPLIVKDICDYCGIVNYGFWSFRATQATSSKRPVNHKNIWDSINFKPVKTSMFI